MNGKFWRLVVGLLPICFLSAQERGPQTPDQTNRPALGQPSPEALRKMWELRQRMKEHAVAINDLAGHIGSLDDARKLVNLVWDEFSDELPSKWSTHSLRERIARAEYESAADPGALIPEQRIADAWNDFVEKIGAPQETMLNAAEVHYLRDSHYVSARLLWAQDHQQIWTVPGIFALGPDGKVAKGSRALEAIRLLWLLRSTEDFSGIHAEVQKGVLFSDSVPHPERPPAPGSVRGYVRVRTNVVYPVGQAASRYMRDHGNRAYHQAVESLVNELLGG